MPNRIHNLQYISFDQLVGAEIRSESGQKGFFVNVKTNLPLSGRVGHSAHTLSGPAELSFAPQQGQDRQNAKTAA